MLFNSAIFLALFVVFYALYWPLPLKGRQTLILATSLIFYAWYSIPFLLFFLALIALNFALSSALIHKKSRGLLWLGLVVDLGALGIFKYFYFFTESAGSIFGLPYLAHIKANLIQDWNFSIVLPIAISFYTFQIVAFLVDCYRGVIDRPVSFRHYAFFILFFPQFVAGPIMRAQDFLSQIDHPAPSHDRMLNGGLLILQGIVKKVLLADHIGHAMAPVWQNPAAYDALTLWIAPLSFGVQVYCDFSGYTDMARGMALLLGYEIPDNFRGPLMAETMQDFWRRWHITLSTWLRDYIYIPLGGSRLGEPRTYLNIMITMALGGLWHGAAWTYLIWGSIIGLYICWDRLRHRKGWLFFPEHGAPAPVRILRVVRTNALFAFCAIFFAVPGLQQAIDLMGGALSMQRGNTVVQIDGVLALILVALIFNALQYWKGVRSFIAGRNGLRYALNIAGTFFVGVVVSAFGDVSGQFIYFQF
ncbi:MAG: MBOAT family protein [Leptospirales bacterium]|nr:MBOAT family protein [Leptospirales bacterium]